MTSWPCWNAVYVWYVCCQP